MQVVADFDSSTKFGERFKQLREEVNLTMEQLAASLGANN